MSRKRPRIEPPVPPSRPEIRQHFPMAPPPPMYQPSSLGRSHPAYAPRELAQAYHGGYMRSPDRPQTDPLPPYSRPPPYIEQNPFAYAPPPVPLSGAWQIPDQPQYPMPPATYLPPGARRRSSPTLLHQRSVEAMSDVSTPGPTRQSSLATEPPIERLPRSYIGALPSCALRLS